MVGTQLNCTQGKQGETGAPMYFFLVNFSPALYISEHLEQASCLQALDLYIFERGFRGLINGGAYIPGGLKLDVLFLLMGRWAYNWMRVISGVGAF